MSNTATLRPSTVHSSSSLRQATLKKNMSITQTYYLAHKARGKLSREAAQPDHDLRLLVGHANLLDSLMIELADAEREQERWFNQSVRGATKTQDRHVQWADSIVEEAEEEYDSDSSSDSDSDDDFDEDIEMHNTSSALRPITSTKPLLQSEDDDLDMEEDDLEEDYAQLELVRTHSHSNSPPELIEHDIEDSSDEESTMPPSPTDSIVELHEKELDAEELEQEQHEDTAIYGKDYYLPSRNPARLVTAISVY